jgi:hypothetical protein
MNTLQIAQNIKQHLIDLAVNDQLPLDMNGLDIAPIEDIIKLEDSKHAFGFDVNDVLQQAEDDEIEITEQEAEAVISLMRYKGDVSIGISWDTVSYFITRIVEERIKE